MKIRIATIAGLGLVLTLSACGPSGGSDETPTPDKTTAQDKSALNGGPWTWMSAPFRKCLDSNASGSVYTIDCNGGPYQRWTNTPNYYGDTIKNLATGRCLDSNFEGSVYTLPCNGGIYQQWVVTFRPNGWELRNAQTGRCLSFDEGNSYTDPCLIGPYTDYQRWL